VETGELEVINVNVSDFALRIVMYWPPTCAQFNDECSQYNL